MTRFDAFMAGANPNAPTPAEEFVSFLGALDTDAVDQALSEQATPEPEAPAQASLDLGTLGTPVSASNPGAEFAKWAQQ